MSAPCRGARLIEEHGAFAPLGIPSHPWPVYEMIWSVFSILVLWRLNGRLKPTGSLMLVYFILYSIGRFLLTFMRQERILFLGLQEAHIFSIVVLLFSVPALIWLVTSNRAAQPRATEARSV